MGELLHRWVEGLPFALPFLILGVYLMVESYNSRKKG